MFGVPRGVVGGGEEEGDDEGDAGDALWQFSQDKGRFSLARSLNSAIVIPEQALLTQWLPPAQRKA